MCNQVGWDMTVKDSVLSVWFGGMTMVYLTLLRSGTYRKLCGYTIDLADYSRFLGHLYWVRINSGTSVFIDDIRWESIPACMDVANDYA
jgi:hypothetical protein